MHDTMYLEPLTTGKPMSSTPHMQFRRLEEPELALAMEVLRSLADAGESSGESFGLQSDTRRLKSDEAWGLFIRGELAGAAWTRRSGAVAEIPALALPKGWWRLGLSAWMLEQLAESARLGGASATVVHLDQGGPDVGEALLDAGFTGPEPESENFPRGDWHRL